ncbi:hypothetical protein [Pseudoalteromonas rubra]|uniref:Peptidase n=1 Tax=Pseudoalteromonas rubra TaxID=43658 RepID=A0A0U3GFP3_9GAMM|nr:hypothetical protein [Pseudoalteromonas rubra]ALU41931.1 hypothetical protein AT705_02695 [Pseudoalteromonas rubra]
MAAKKTNTNFDWFEIFRAGTHTDSSGQTQEFTEADLNSVVTNFTPKTSPLVIGHPDMNAPAWGWTSELKVEDGALFARAEDVAVEFAEAVEDKRYPNRSVRLEGKAGNYTLGHIGYLGGKPPAVAGMPWQFNGDEPGVVFEFAASDADERVDDVALQAARTLTDFMGNLREWFIEQYGKETADRVMPNWDADWLKRQTAIADHEKDKERYGDHRFSAPPPKEETQVSEPTDQEKALQAKLDAAEQQNAKLQFSQRKIAAQTFIDTEVNGGKAPRVTSTDGLADFMANLEAGDDATFEFAAADGSGTNTVKPAEFFKSFLKSLPEQGGLMKDFSAHDGQEGDGELTAEQLASKASDFQLSEAKQGRTISISAAMAHVKQESKNG